MYHKGMFGWYMYSSRGDVAKDYHKSRQNYNNKNETHRFARRIDL